MRQQRWRSRFACLWSVEMIFPALSEALLFQLERPDLPHGYQSYGYLWTWTLPDEQGQNAAAYAMRCWLKHAQWLRDRGWRCVRVIERGKKTGLYHFHAVTDQRWPVEAVRAHAVKCGFGRINVKVVPRSKIFYLAKYISKRTRWPIPKNVKVWGTVGFKGVRMCDVFCTIQSLTVPTFNVRPLLTTHKIWCFDGQPIVEYNIRPNDAPDQRIEYKMNITKDNMLGVAQLLATGAILAIAEYRTCETREMTFNEENKKTGQPTGKKITRKLVEHGVEVGSKQITVTQWLPDDADLKAVKSPANKGEPVVIEIEGFSKQWGITASSIKPIGLFAGKVS